MILMFQHILVANYYEIAMSVLSLEAVQADPSIPRFHLAWPDLLLSTTFSWIIYAKYPPGF